MSKSEIDELKQAIKEMHDANVAQHKELTDAISEIAYSLNGTNGSIGLVARVKELEGFAKKNNFSDVIKTTLTALVTAITSVLGTIGVLIATKIIGG